MPEVTFSGLHLDSSSNKLVTVTYGHHELHDGNAFSCHYEQAVTETNDFSIITFKTPDTTKWVHMFFSVAAGFNCFFRYLSPETNILDPLAGKILHKIERNRKKVGFLKKGEIELSGYI